MNICSYIDIFLSILLEVSTNMTQEFEKEVDYMENEHPLDEETLFVVSQTFKALSDPTRIRILNLLCSAEHSVNELAERLDLGQSTVSHQLRFLKQLRLVKYRRAGTTLYYSKDDDHIMNLLKQAIEHAAHH